MDLLSWVRSHAERAGWSPEEIRRALIEPGSIQSRVNFVAELKRCPGCLGPLSVYKTRTRTVVTLAAGSFEAKVTQLRCDCGPAQRSESCSTVESKHLCALVPSGQRFGYDLIVYVGLARYLDGKQREEIRAALQQRGIEVSTASISKLCDRFLLYLEMLHLQCTEQLRATLGQGYSLHIDATSDSGKGGLFLCLDGMHGWVLAAERIATENGDLLTPVVERTVERFGKPLATMRDLSSAMAAAVKPLRERGIPDLVCHYHFLRAVGTKLLEQPYGRLRTMLKAIAPQSELVALRRALRPYLDGGGTQQRFGPGRVRDGLLALVHWLIEGAGGKDPDFPFALPHLDRVLRCRAVSEVASRWLPRPLNQPERRAMRTLDGLRRRLDKDPRMASTVAELQERWKAFGELRSVLCMADSELPGGQQSRQMPTNGDDEVLRLEQISLAVRHYRDDLRQRPGNDANKKRPDRPESIVLRYLESYRDNLFGHPAIRDDDQRVIAVMPRTNNPVEQFFGIGKQALRRRLGRANLARDLQQQPAQAALVANLRRADYVRIVCGSLENLAHTFAQLDLSKIKNLRLKRDHRDSRLDRVVSSLIKHFPLPESLQLPPLKPRFSLHPTQF
ncbi:MAG: hypothetical protein ACE5E4_13050 [Candidatus Binatia bacterium]